MRLRYIRGSEIIVRFKGEAEPYYGGVLFSPEAELPDNLATRLLNNPIHFGCFEVVKGTNPQVTVVDAPKLKCPFCPREFTRAAALGAHKRIHQKESGT